MNNLTQEVKDEALFKNLQDRANLPQRTSLEYFEPYRSDMPLTGFFLSCPMFDLPLLVKVTDIRNMKHSIGQLELYVKHKDYAVHVSSYSRIRNNLPKFSRGQLLLKIRQHAENFIKDITQWTNTI